MIDWDQWFLLRTPLLALHPVASTRDEDAAPLTFKDVCTHVRQMCRDSVFMEALWLNSSSLHRAALKLEELSGKRRERAVSAIWRYYVRMSYRSTPFGLNAGVSVGAVANRTLIQIAPQAAFRRHTRLDGLAVQKWIEEACAQAWDVEVRINTSLYERAGRYFYAQRQGDGSGPQFELVSVSRSPELDLVLSVAERSSSRVRTLAARIQEEWPDLEDRETVAFVRDLVAEQLLVPKVSVSQDGTDERGTACLRLVGADATAYAVDELCANLDKILGNELSAYEELDSLLGRGSEASCGVQVDLFKPSIKCEISGDVLHAVAAAADSLRKITRPEESLLDRFKIRFVDRFGDATIPLLMAFDPEYGVSFDDDTDGYGNRPGEGGLVTGMPNNWLERDRYLLDLLSTTWKRDASSLMLTDEDLEQMRNPCAREFPPSFSVVGRVLDEAGMGTPLFQLISAGGPPGTRMSARFAHLDSRIEDGVRNDAVRDEALESMPLAEVRHLPDHKTRNVTATPPVRQFEIPYLAAPTVSEERVMWPRDLFVRVFADEIHLLHGPSGQRILPRISNAFVYWSKPNLPVFRFLGMLQHEKTQAGVRWDWGPFALASSLPRVLIDRVVVAKRQWYVRTATMNDVAGSTVRLREWRRSRGIDRFCVFKQQFEEFPLDLESVYSVRDVLAQVGSARGFVLAERLHEAESVVRGEGGGTNHEVVFVLNNRSTAPAERGSGPEQAPLCVVTPGQDWVYAKVYTGVREAERVLQELHDTVLMRSPLQWFFVRYADPGPHLRVRVKSTPDNWGAITEDLNGVLGRLTSTGSVSSYSYDSYFPEASRYGGVELLPLVEQLFCVDSEAVMRLVSCAPDEVERLIYAVESTADWVSRLIPSENEKESFVTRMRTAFLNEFSLTPQSFHSLRGRDVVARIANYQNLTHTARVKEILRVRALESSESAAALRQLWRNGSCTNDWENMVSSVIHMSLNRIFESRQRERELDTYHVLFLANRRAKALARTGRQPIR